jgi:cell division protein FtsN
VSEASHDFSEEGFHEIHLTGKQLVFLFMATTVVSVIIFLCGVLVGRGVPVQTAQDPLVGTTATAAADPTPTPSQAPPPATEPPSARAEPPSPTPEEAGEDLTYKKRLEEESATKESVKPRQPEPVPARSRPPAAAPEPPSPAPQPGTWVVQVHALRDRNVANGIVQRLTGKGYPAFLVASGPPTGTYKVQVGRFKDRDDAARVVERLKKEEQFKPWITR